MDCSITHKIHLLLLHAVDVTRSRKGIVHLREIRLERVHQTQFQNNQIESRMSDKIKGQ